MAQTSFSVAVIGTGAIGIDHIISFQSHPAASVVAVADSSVERAHAAAEKYRIPTVVADYRELLRRKDIDIVSIALPNYLHAEVALAALRAKKHVMLEKPMCTRAADAVKIAAEARKQKVLLMVGQNHRFAPEVQTAKQLIEEGVLGDVYHAKTAWTRRAGIPRIGSWFTQRKLSGGGVTYDIGVHALDRCLYLMDEFTAVAVSGKTFTQFGHRGLGDGDWGKSEIDPRKPFDVDDLAVALIKLKSGRTILLEASWAAHQPQIDFNGTQLFGTQAGLLFPPVQLFRDGEHGYSTELVTLKKPLVNTNRMGHFIEVLLGKEKLFVPPAQSVAVQKILDGIYESSRSGKEIRIR
ncbi:MAG TPA: Gfo/Idh/MocA family oxidoreductase [Opitutaceae bacterium]|nr:Gfo/Idh/MocA family oxidoreductase [Opitutaceae bacterium]